MSRQVGALLDASGGIYAWRWSKVNDEKCSWCQDTPFRSFILAHKTRGHWLVLSFDEQCIESTWARVTYWFRRTGTSWYPGSWEVFSWQGVLTSRNPSSSQKDSWDVLVCKTAHPQIPDYSPKFWHQGHIQKIKMKDKEQNPKMKMVLPHDANFSLLALFQKPSFSSIYFTWFTQKCTNLSKVYISPPHLNEDDDLATKFNEEKLNLLQVTHFLKLTLVHKSSSSSSSPVPLKSTLILHQSTTYHWRWWVRNQIHWGPTHLHQSTDHMSLDMKVYEQKSMMNNVLFSKTHLFC